MIRLPVSPRRKLHTVAAALSILVATLGVAPAAHATYCYSNWSSAATSSRSATAQLWHIEHPHTYYWWFQACTKVDTANSSAGLWVKYDTFEKAPPGQQAQFQGRMQVLCQDGSTKFSNWHDDTEW